MFGVCTWARGEKAEAFTLAPLPHEPTGDHLQLEMKMKMKMKGLSNSSPAIARAAVLFFVAAAATCWSGEGVQATQYTVGGSSGWTLGVDYTTWASQSSFKTGDSLVFSYGELHSVLQVSESDYKACITTNALSTGTGGNTVVKLENAQTYYFICGVASHCGSGMQLSVTVGGTSSSPSTGTTTPSTSKTPTTPSSSSMEPSSATFVISYYSLPTFTIFFTLLHLFVSKA
ncbi:hypothetical protein GOP47_0013752 [Adiantum capillus-veneris]|uniref:Phytocyanin domain-containing protein n=1 Tax=Adiantum capillus-veneris TaxID=13818 RepID=A0A9D4ZG29_ADICA|nr:hypothetical protein GOP47_0013752 [Adiantum capillus-veneris]